MTESADILDSGREIFKRLVAVENNVVIYPPNHPALIEPAAEICELLKPLFVDRQRVSFSIVNSEIYIEKHLLREESIRHSGFIRLLMDRGVNNLLFDSRVTPESITMFFSFVNVKGEPEGGPGSLKSLIRRAGVVGIGFEELVAFDVYELKDEPQDVSAAHASYDGALECMETMSHDILSNRGIDIASLNVVISSLMGDFLNKKDAIIGLMSIKNYNEHLFHHSVNVALTCLLIANSLNLTEEMVRTVGVSGLLHDIGKLIHALYLPQEFSRVIAEVEHTRIPMIESEQGIFGFTHTHTGRILAEKWHFPEETVNMVAQHHLEDDSPNVSKEVAAVHLGNTLCIAFGLGSAGEKVVPTVNQKAWEILGLQLSDLESISGRIHNSFRGASVILE